jgi:hypothetical protein
MRENTPSRRHLAFDFEERIDARRSTVQVRVTEHLHHFDMVVKLGIVQRSVSRLGGLRNTVSSITASCAITVPWSRQLRIAEARRPYQHDPQLQQ